MLIALVSDCYLPRLGGIEVQVADLAAHLRSAGHSVVVVTATRGPQQPGVCRLDSPVSGGVPVNPWAGPQLRAVLARADIVHVHLGVLAPFAQMAATIAVELGLPVVLTWHSLVSGSVLTPALRRSWRKWVQAGAVPMAVSTVAAQQVSLALGGEDVEVLRNGLDLQRWRGQSERTASSRSGHQPIQVISAMRFAVRKRPVRLMSIMSAVAKALPEPDGLHLTICGDGPWLRPLHRLVGHSSMRAWVDLPGRVSRDELAARYRQSDLYLASARQEAFGIAALEARSAGLPVAGYADSGVSDVVQDGVGGVLAVSDADMVRRLSALLSDSSQLESMARYHREHLLAHHDWAAVTEATLRTYEGIMVSR